MAQCVFVAIVSATERLVNKKVGAAMRKSEVALKPTVVSLFSGCGGIDLGFEAAGFQTKAVLDIALYAGETLRKNFPEAKVIAPPLYSGDITDPTAVNQLPARGVDVLVGGPPCQSFSIAAAQRFLKSDKKFKRTGFRDRKRGVLMHYFLKVLAEMRPRVFVIENVPGLQDLDGGKELLEILRFCRGLGYRIAEPAVLQAADYGVPQYRQRLIVIGVRGQRAQEATFPSATHSDTKDLFTLLPSHVTVAEALAYLPVKARNHVPREHNASSVARYRRLRFGQREKLGRVDRLDPRRPSKTVIAGGMNGGGRSHLHPFLARTLTVRECARLQTFPDAFEFMGGMSRQFTQVGNAVPPLLAELLARSIGRQFFGLSYADAPTFRTNRRSRSVEVCVADLLRQAQDEAEYLYDDLVAS